MGILENKVCIITGAASGIGKATTESFIAEGGKVYAIDIKEIKNTKVKEKYLCDIRDYNKLEEIINLIYQKERKEINTREVIDKIKEYYSKILNKKRFNCIEFEL